MEIQNRDKKKVETIFGIGYQSVQNGKYSYDYPFMKEIQGNLIKGDILRIAIKFNRELGLSRDYIYKIIQGKKYNEKVITEAKRIAEQNVKNGYVNN